ncbi:MAG: hypothetical protein HW383_11 [Candidatus Magasanikbacteria bacterium]|nr:hypothetical protein [Candidatus Magasanikbacteria bacterium]
MAFNIIPLIIIIISLAGILAIVVRKFPQLAALDVSTISGAVEQEKKRALLMQRVKRQIGGGWEKFLSMLGPVGRKIFGVQERFRAFVNRVADKYRMLEQLTKKKAALMMTPKEKKSALEILLDEADALRKEEKFEEAEKKYVEAIALAPKSVRAYKGLGKLYFETEKWPQAKETWEFVLKISTTEPLAYAYLGRIAKERGEWETAAKYFEQAVALDDSLIKRWLDLADVYKTLGKMPEAVAAAKKAVVLEPANPLVLDNLAEISILSGDRKSAVAAVQNLRDANPENAKINEFEERIKGMGK